VLKLQPCSNRSNRWKRVSQLGHPIYPFLNQNLFFFFAASATVRQPRRSTPQHSQQGRGGCWHTRMCVMILIRKLPPPRPSPELSIPERSDHPNAHTGRAGTKFLTLRLLSGCSGSLNAANGSNWRMCVAPALIHQEFPLHCM
jgi:hypothetical protein